MENKSVNIFTDGSSRGNPGPGGFGVVLQYGAYEKVISQGFRLTTNNRMELLAVIIGLETLKRPMPCVIYSDSKYVVDAITKGWLDSWIKTGFKKKKNSDLWLRYVEAAKPHKISFVWLKGHAGHPQNERCDKMAVEAALSANLLIDEVFESLGEDEKNDTLL